MRAMPTTQASAHHLSRVYMLDSGWNHGYMGMTKLTKPV